MDKYFNGFKQGKFISEINVENFIELNFTEYNGGSDFLCEKTERTAALFNIVENLLKEETKRGGVYDIDTEKVSSLLSYEVGYINKDLELIVGLQTDAPLKRAVNPFGGLKMCEGACEAYGYTLSNKVKEYFKYRTTHNDAVFRCYSAEMKLARKAGIITGLPDAYGRGRIIGDYRRLPLYGMDRLIEEKRADKDFLHTLEIDEETIRLIEEVSKQISFMNDLKIMAHDYGFDISKPANSAIEAVQWLYFAYLGAIKEQNGAAMSIGRISTFLDIYFERDLNAGLITESMAQEIIDQFVIKLRLVRHLRTPEYNELFAGDPTWVTMSEGGMCGNKSFVTKTSYRVLKTLYNLGSSCEPNITILWSEKLPKFYKEYCAKVSIDTASIQYENDDLMSKTYGKDYSIACCVSAMKTGKQMQFFGARCNLPKILLYALNGGVDEILNQQVAIKGKVYPNKQLDYNEIKPLFDKYQAWLVKLYVGTMNLIHSMHDKYAYERLQMSFHDTFVQRLMAFGVAGLSVLTDSFSAIKYAKVFPVFKDNLIVDFEIIGDYPKFGNDIDDVDLIAKDICHNFIKEIEKHTIYRSATPTLSVLTITSNVVYGKKTGATPDGRKLGEAFAPGANPMSGRDESGALASLNSVAKLDFADCKDGISNTFSITPTGLGNSANVRISNLCDIIDGYFKQNSQHLNVNVLNRDILVSAMENPELYPNLTIRISGYAVNFNKLSSGHKMEIISRTFHEHF